MAPSARRTGSALAGLGLMRRPFARDSRRRRQEELLLDLIRQVTRVGVELHRANVIQSHRFMSEYQDRAIDDASLAAALSTLHGLTDAKRRQMLFANREYAAILLAHRVGVFDWDELIGHLRVLCRNQVFAEYWERTVEHRRSLAVESLDARVGKALDVIFDELADDPEEWWVVGPAPGTTDE
ncbi:DUF6082 family protein [Streptomyces fructofermentans]|uniref:Uncharacterized protein n=1 Tax=Streptomyces fructofermentans TaxID=152141 RepID=A0A918NJU6_9ACTN|nr:DUF6082 family protein [Streptomyces fructofermentans]GGX73360.1 hypothetical protein GCM10010515_46160 [Streptomyces fructofermentans]